MKTNSNIIRNSASGLIIGAIMFNSIYDEDISNNYNSLRESVCTSKVNSTQNSEVYVNILSDYSKYLDNDVRDVQILAKLTHDFINKSIDIDSDFVEIVDDNFWDLF